jgi:NTP pyrophosphatase (non-canonical NTP hydrolase)
MDSKTYLKESARTVSEDYSAIGQRLSPGDELQKKKTIDLLHAGMGMATESSEFLDMLKKHLFYGKPLDEVNLREEVADQLWYCALALRALDTDFETVMKTNIDKLKARYPQKFTEESALNRDLDKERKILENE